MAAGRGRTPGQLGVAACVVGQGGRVEGAVLAQAAGGVFAVVVVLAVVATVVVGLAAVVAVVAVEGAVLDVDFVADGVPEEVVAEEDDGPPDEVVEPEVVEPDVVEPEVVDPEVVEPEVVEPEVVAPDVVAPDVVAPDVVEPELVDPEVVEPDGVVGCHGAGGGTPGASGPFGGSTGLSTILICPVARANQPPVSMFTRTIAVTGCGAGTTTTSVDGWKPVQAFPVYLALLISFGGPNGLPQAQRTRGTPWASTRTAVPACSADWYSTAAPLL